MANVFCEELVQLEREFADQRVEKWRRSVWWMYVMGVLSGAILLIVQWLK
jgi:hypothetical protein